MSKPDGGPAFPAHPERDLYSGMSLRDYLAGQAVSGMMSCLSDVDPERVEEAGEGFFHAAIATQAYEVADAMLKAREEAG